MAKRTPEREQFLADVLTTAVEGGINSWSVTSEYKNEYSVPVADTFATVHEVDPDEGIEEDEDGYAVRGLRVDIDVIAKGIGVIKGFDYQPNYFGDGGEYWRQFLLADRTNGSDGDYDAIVADWIVQAGLFGSIVYG
jgi:hypothetical protein